MKNQKIVSLIFILIFLNIIISVSKSQAVTYTENIILAPGDYVYVNERMSLESEIEWRFARRGEGVIYVVAFDQENFDLYESGETYSYNSLSISSLFMDSGIFNVPKSDNWHIVFICILTYTNLTYEVTFHKPNLGVILGITGGVIGIGIIIGGILFSKKKKKN
jgi:hypothetical protein